MQNDSRGKGAADGKKETKRIAGRIKMIYPAWLLF